MIATVRKVLDLLTARERKQAYLLLPLVIAMALAEVAGIASIAPFLTLIADPEAARTNPILAWFYELGSFETDRQFLVAIGVLALLALLASNVVLSLGHYGLFKFGAMRNHSISYRLLVRYLQQPYTFFLERNSSALANNILQEVLQVINGIVIPMLLGIAKAVAVLAIMVLLVVLNPAMAGLMAVLLGGGYGLIYGLVRKRLRRMGMERVKANQARYKAANEAMGGIKDLKLLGREPELIRQFIGPSQQFAIYEANQKVITMVPRFALEAVAFGGMLVVVLVLLATGAGIMQILPLLGMYAFAGYRLLPALNVVFQGMTRMRYSIGALNEVHEMVQRVDAKSADPSDFTSQENLEPLPLRTSLALEGVRYAYPNTGEAVLHDVDLSIRPRTSVAFVGATGSGKTTLVDLVLGLLEPTGGRIVVDGVPLTSDNVDRWQRSIGYVSQSIFLTDDTIARNIALGIRKEHIDMDAVRRAARMAQIDRFVTENLRDGYDTVVGERGVRLSGGQRQRLGIARALYHDPEVLVFDEATSALDGTTESRVYEAVRALAGHKTIITVAHRLGTIRDSDTIYVLDDGRLTHQGTYEHLMHVSPQFRTMAMDGAAHA